LVREQSSPAPIFFPHPPIIVLLNEEGEFFNMRMVKMVVIIAFAAFVSTALGAERLYDSVTFAGYGALQAGQLVRGYYNAVYSQVNENRNNRLVQHQWIESIRSRLSGTFYKGPSVKVNLGIEFNCDFSTIYNPGPNPDNNKSMIPLTYYNDLLIHRADIEYGFLSSENSSLKLQLGYFPFKYNPQATNLGEYLFRSECYPNHIVNEFYFAETRLLGAVLGGSLTGAAANLSGNLLLTSEMTYPVQDFSLAGLVNADFLNDAFELGGGIQFQRLIPVDPHRTTPHTSKNTIAIDSVNQDTSFYTFSGTKVMARICFDIKKLAPMSFLGDEDLNIYGECAILGLKNYDTIYYDKISERMPVMFGFTVPTLKMLDLLALEAEYYTNPYFNNNRNQWYPANIENDNNLPATPYIIPGQEDDVDGGHGAVRTIHHRWKWSVFAKKKFGDNFQMVAQVARDHSRFQDPMNRLPYYTYDGDVTTAGNDWYYQVRLMWCF
jgi:hypothetical protein